MRPLQIIGKRICEWIKNKREPILMGEMRSLCGLVKGGFRDGPLIILVRRTLKEWKKSILYERRILQASCLLYR
jgi:hypothetical protein